MAPHMHEKPELLSWTDKGAERPTPGYSESDEIFRMYSGAYEVVLALSLTFESEKESQAPRIGVGQ